MTRAVFLVAAAACSTSAPAVDGGSDAVSDASCPTVTQPAFWQTTTSSIDPSKLPLRTGSFVTDCACQSAPPCSSTPQKGTVFVCDPHAYEQDGGPGGSGGPWVDEDAGTFDMAHKPFWNGDVLWPTAQFSITPSGDQRVVSGNGLPVCEQTGVYPVPSSDPSFKYDSNPNAISAQTISFSIPANPTVQSTPTCVYKEIGITLDGIQLHNPLDSHGRDEIAYQIQDVCSGDPQPGGGYHRHVPGECTPHVHDNLALVGYALDGFGIFSPYDASGNELTSADLDECHGTTSAIPWDGQTVTMYHYVMTRDFPYTVACFRGQPTRNAFPPLLGAPPQTCP
jgi:hypothetical protein